MGDRGRELSSPVGSPVARALAGRALGRGDGSFLVADWSIDPPAPDVGPAWMAPLHRHRGDDEIWYVLSGRLSVRLDAETVTVGAGGAVLAAAGVAHTFGNPGPEPCRYLIVMTAQIARLIDALHAVEPGADRAAVFAAHDSELLG